MPRADDLAAPRLEARRRGEDAPDRPATQMRSSVGALTGVGGQEAAPSDQGGAGQWLVLRWACVILVHGCTCMGLWLGMERLYFGVVGQPAAGECDTHFEAGSRRLVHEFIGWAPVWGRNAVLVAGVLWVCRKVAGLERTPGTVQALLLGVGEQDGQARTAGWDAIVGSGVGGGGADNDGTTVEKQPRFEQARSEREMSYRQAVVVASSKLALWHWSQPCAYLWLLWVYRCYVVGLGRAQQHLAAVVAAREALYLLSTLLATWQCPVYLLLDLRTVWNEAEGKLQRSLRLAMYILTPHNFVALSLARRFPSLRQAFLGLGAAQVLADLSSCFALAALLANTLEARATIAEDVVPLIVGKLCAEDWAGSSKHHAGRDGLTFALRWWRLQATRSQRLASCYSSGP